MRFDTLQHMCSCGTDRHVDWMYLCVLDADGEVRLHHNIPTHPQAFLLAVKPFGEDVVVRVECLFTWDLALLISYDRLLTELELSLVNTAKAHNAQIFYYLRSIPGVGKILALGHMVSKHSRTLPSGRVHAAV